MTTLSITMRAFMWALPVDSSKTHPTLTDEAKAAQKGATQLPTAPFGSAVLCLPGAGRVSPHECQSHNATEVAR